MIRLGVTGMKKPGWCTSWTCLAEGGGEFVWFSVLEAPLDDWADGGSVDVFFMYGEYGFSSVEM